MTLATIFVPSALLLELLLEELLLVASLLSSPLIGVKPRMPVAETDTPRRKTRRRLSFIVGSFDLFVIVILL
jgi:hypothetical protein